MKIARVFPRRTKATPKDELVFIGDPPQHPPQLDEIYISIAFTWDLPEANRLKTKWSQFAPVKIGGPATGQRGEDFTPGLFLKPGYVITSRGCDNNCWFCSVPKREGNIRELRITEGNNLLDDNIIATSDWHFLAVIEMLKRQKRVQFTGGLEAARLQQWQAEAIRSVNPKQIFFAYDLPDDNEPLVRAINLCWGAGFTKKSHAIRVFVLCGYPKDTIEAAEKRMEFVLKLGAIPMAMRWHSEDYYSWYYFQKKWARPATARL